MEEDWDQKGVMGILSRSVHHGILLDHIKVYMFVSLIGMVWVDGLMDTEKTRCRWCCRLQQMIIPVLPCVSLSSDGITVAIGEIFISAKKRTMEYVRIYNGHDMDGWIQKAKIFMSKQLMISLALRCLLRIMVTHPR